jgi:hypothetical protein
LVFPALYGEYTITKDVNGRNKREPQPQQYHSKDYLPKKGYIEKQKKALAS